MSTKARAVRIKASGGPEVLALEELDVRDPGPTEVLVEIVATGLNRADLLQRKGVYPAPPGVVPDVPGLEFSGRVAKLGSEVRSLKLGDAVMAICAGGACATHIVMHERELLRVPANIDLVQAAAIPEVFMTAYDALFLQSRLGLGQYALIHAIGSGIGTAALQLIQATGAFAIGTSRKAEKLERLKAFGLEHGIVTAEPRFAERVKEITGGRLAHAVLDTIGASYLSENLRAVAPGGTIVTIGMLGGATAELPLWLLVSKRATLRGSVLRSRPLEEKIALARTFSEAVLPLFAQGRLRPVVEEVISMTDVQKAHAHMESDELFGKLVLTW
ncbi:MAG: NAD(P)H-quinone oxidoreductase [Myxococcaceae bacterium]|nr:NAD(P)H-quinone oxidoreductase [Myxococcaceae bacterium]